MIQAVHAGAADGTVRQKGIPALPDRCGPQVHLIQPPRVILIQKQGISLLGKPRLRKGLAQISRSHKPGQQMIAVGREKSGKPAGRSIHFLLIKDMEMNPQHISRLGIDGKFSLPCHIPLPHCLADGPGYFRIIGLILRLSQNFCRPGRQSSSIHIINRCHQMLICAALPVIIAFCIQRQPVPEMESAGPEPFSAAERLIHMNDEIRPQLHILILFFQKGAVSVKLIQVPGNDHRRISPDAGSRLSPEILSQVKFRLAVLSAGQGQDVGNHVRHRTALFLLLILHILQIFPEKCRSLHVIAGSAAEDLGIPRPSQAFVPLGTVCGDIQKIILLAPQRIGKKTVHFLIGGNNLSRLRQIRIKGPCFKISHIGFIHLHSGYLYIPEPVIGKMRPHKLPRTIADKGVFRPGRTQVIPVKSAVLKDFSVLQDNPLPGRSFRPECRPAGNLLAEIQHRLTDIRGDNLLYLKNLFFPYRQTCHRRKSSFRPIGSSCMETFSLRRLQHILFHPCIIHLPVINAGDCHRGF